jgi:alpha-1,2-mannosyltransferase
VDAAALARLGRTALPIVAVLSVGLSVPAVLAFAGETLGYDFLAYHAAASRLISGEPLYDLSFEVAGGFGLFYYPPFFAPLIIAFGLLPEAVAIWAWILVLLAAFAVGVSVIPVSRTIKWWIVLLAGLSWPFVYAVKLGQVGPILLLLFAIGWRWLDDPRRLGASVALGTAIKLQPALLFLWALATRRWMAVAVGAVTLAALALLATLLAGVVAWSDFALLLGRVVDPIQTAHNVTPGAIAYQLGASHMAATAVQWATIAGSVLAVLVSCWLGTAAASYLVAVIASQLVSPILWDHYVMLLLLPVAYLASKGHWWALLIPLATAWPLVGATPPVAYPVSLFLALVATLVVGIRQRSVEAT